MSIVERREKLFELVPEGVPVTRSYLLQKGFSVHALDNAVKSGQLETLAHGVYARPKTNITWQGIVCSLQHLPARGLSIGGLTALEMQGLGHYLPMGGQRVVHLFGIDKPPNWVSKLLSDVTFVHHNINALGARYLVNHEYDPVKRETYLQDPLHNSTLSLPWREGAWPLTASSPERAMLEVLFDVPKEISFEHADQLMQGLNTLSPTRVQKLLESCQNVQAKRLFLWLAERNRHTWLKKLDLSKIHLGTGHRSIAKGGKFDSKYQITVPEDMWTKTGSTTSKSNS